MRFDSPFRHAVIDDYISEDAIRKINRTWPDNGWHKENGKGQIKWSTQKVTPPAQAVIDAIDIPEIEQLTGIPGLIADPDLCGAGLHCIPRGGFLKMHCDFNTHAKGWHRRVNMLIFLNEEWKDEWGGRLCLGLNGEKQILPIAGRCVIFETNDATWHGHPEPLLCPEGVQRRSIAVYFYTEKPPKKPPHTTVYIK